jgi:hypothetical protein
MACHTNSKDLLASVGRRVVFAVMPALIANAMGDPTPLPSPAGGEGCLFANDETSFYGDTSGAVVR